MRRLAAPSASGEFLAEPGFESVASQIAANRKWLDESQITIAGQSLAELRQQARRELLAAAAAYSQEAIPANTAPLILTGHQPELSHPGVWVKNFAANGLARRLGGIALNLIADTDTLKSASIRVPTWTGADLASAKVAAIPFDDHAGEVPYERRMIHSETLFRNFGERLSEATANWPQPPLGIAAWKSISQTGTIGERFANLRRTFERHWGCTNLELPVSRLATLASFAAFVRHIDRDAERFREVYNLALADYRRGHRLRSRSHPAPDLAEGELPFWRMTETKRERAFDAKNIEQLRPRALTLTLFARLVLGDYFLHGLGGGKYDEVTDTIIRHFFRIEPPAFQILTATLHLPLPRLSITVENFRDFKWSARYVYWNPQMLLLGRDSDSKWEDQHQRIVESPVTTREQRRERYRMFRLLAEKLRPIVSDRIAKEENAVKTLEREVVANAILTRRDYAWILYPESELKPFLQRFLSV